MNKPFKNKKIYFSNSISGDIGTTKAISIDLVKFMLTKGANVLSEDVAFRDPKIMFPIFKKKTGVDLSKIRNKDKKAEMIRKVDLNWVDEADYFIAVVNGASYGVGMEIQRAIDKPRLGLYETPILCLVHKDILKDVSPMIRGVSKKEAPNFQLKTYKDLKNVKEIVHKFLTE